MRKNSRKGFTIVELVIVIAVIAILAAVLIPTFSGIIDKANTSADIQLIREANMLIQAEMIDLDRSLTKDEADKVLTDNGIDISKVTNTNNTFYYDAESCCFVIWNNETNTVVFPEESDFLPSFKLTYDWNLNGKTFEEGKSMNTGYVLDWSKDFIIEQTINFDAYNKAVIMFDILDTGYKGFQLAIVGDSNPSVLLHVNHNDISDQKRTIKTGDLTTIFKWDANEKKISIELKQDDEDTQYITFNAEDKDLDTRQPVWIGAERQHKSGNNYNKVTVKSFKITTSVKYDTSLTYLTVESNISGFQAPSWGDINKMPAQDTTITANWGT